MREVINQVERWRHGGKCVALARVVGVEGSGPREAGATMAVSEDGEVAGSVSGGCVEGAVVTEALAALARHEGARRCTFGYSDHEAFAVGLSCGGTIHLLIDPELPSVYEEVRDALERSEPVALATVTALGGEASSDAAFGGVCEAGGESLVDVGGRLPRPGLAPACWCARTVASPVHWAKCTLTRSSGVTPPAPWRAGCWPPATTGRPGRRVSGPLRCSSRCSHGRPGS
jgi:hypothetical protein